MGEELKEWAHMWGAKVSNTIVMIILIYIHLTLKVKLRNDMPDDILKDAIETSRRVLESITDFESQGNIITINKFYYHYYRYYYHLQLYYYYYFHL